MASVTSSVNCIVTPATARNAATNVTFTTSVNAASSGLGECNNVISKSTLFNPKEGFQAINGVVNEGRYHGQLSTSYDPTTAENPVSTYYQNAQGATTLFKNYVSRNDAAGVTYNIFATIPMAVLHDFFDKLPITRGWTVRLNLYVNCGLTIVEQVNDLQHVSITSYNIPRQTFLIHGFPYWNRSYYWHWFRCGRSYYFSHLHFENWK